MNSRLISLGLVILSLVSGKASGRENGSRAEYIGGTSPALTGSVEGSVRTSDPANFEFICRQAVLRIPYDRINLIEYGQKVDRRYAMAILISPILLLSKKRTHFLTVGYSDEAGNQHAMVFRLDKHKVRAILASLEARTGRKVQFQDEEARRAGRG